MEGLCRGWEKAGLDQTGTCLASRRLRSLKQAPVWHYTKCRTLNRHLFAFPKLLRFEDGIVVCERPPRGSGEGLLRGRGPIKISAGCLLLRPTKEFE